MAKRKDLFIDGLHQIHFIGGVIRMDLAILEPRQGNEEPATKVTERIIMTPQSFLEMNKTIQNLMERLVEAGVYSLNPVENTEKNEKRNKRNSIKKTE